MFQSLRQQNKIKSNTVEINLAPLIDMVFILLIFFLVTSTFASSSGMRVNKPQSTFSSSLDSGSMRISITASGNIYTGGQNVDLLVLRNKVRQFVSRERKSSVIIIPDVNVLAGLLVEVMDAAKLAGATDIAIATRRSGTTVQE